MPNLAPIPASARLGLTPRFLVVVDGLDLGGWSKCDGIGVTMKLHDYKPFGENNFTPVLPDRLEYSAITLTRAVNDKDSPKLLAWLGSRANKAASGTGAIVVLGTDRKPVMTYQLRGVYPSAYKGPSLDAGTKSIATETLTLAHEGFLPGV